jgi:hypothetical protein
VDAVLPVLEPRPDPVADEPPAVQPLVHDDPIAAVPVPPTDGPLIAPIVNAAPVYARPEKGAERVGYLRIGARVPRSEEPVSLSDCAGGWYAVRPLGFVCAGADLSVSLEHPLARAIQIEPQRSKPLPYVYAFTRAASPNYLKVPSSEEQFQYEEQLARHLREHKQLPVPEEMAVGANDVPLGAAASAHGERPLRWRRQGRTALVARRGPPDRKHRDLRQRAVGGAQRSSTETRGGVADRFVRERRGRAAPALRYHHRCAPVTRGQAGARGRFGLSRLEPA